jgi:hypothetical protein
MERTEEKTKQLEKTNASKFPPQNEGMRTKFFKSEANGRSMSDAIPYKMRFQYSSPTFGGGGSILATDHALVDFTVPPAD